VDIRFNDCTFEVLHTDHSEHHGGEYCMQTVFYDNTVAGACPNDDEESRARAFSLGYGDNIWQMTLEHEIAHILAAKLSGKSHSIILWNVAHGGGNHWPEGGREEEAMTFAIMRLEQTGHRDALLNGYDIAGLLCAYEAVLDALSEEAFA